MGDTGRPAHRRARRLARVGGLALAITAVVAVYAVALRPAAPRADNGSAPARASHPAAPASQARSASQTSPAPRPPTGPMPDLSVPLAGMPPVTDPANIYAAAGPDMLSPAVRGVPYRIHVPDSGGSAVTVIDPATYRVLWSYQTGLNPQHVVPAYDMRTRYVANDLGNSLTPVNPRTGRPAGRGIPVDDPYNLYFTPDGRYAIVVAEARQNLDFRDPHTFALEHRIHVDCAGVDHADFAASGAYLIATCEFAGRLVRVDLHTLNVAGYLDLPGSSPQPPLRVDILLGAAWGESAAGDPARATVLLEEVTSQVTEPSDTIVAQMAAAEVTSLIRRGRFAECEAVAERGGAAAQRAGRPDVAYSIWIQATCALSAAGDLTGALQAADAAVTATRGMTVIELPCLAARAFVLSRLGRHDEALSVAGEQLAKAERMDSSAAAVLARHDTGLISLAAGRYAEAAQLLGEALAEGAEVRRPAARLARAEALARSGRPDEATAEVRRAALEPVRGSDQPWALVPRMTRVQGMIALARGDRAEARRRLQRGR